MKLSADKEYRVAYWSWVATGVFLILWIGGRPESWIILPVLLIGLLIAYLRNWISFEWRSDSRNAFVLFVVLLGGSTVCLLSLIFYTLEASQMIPLMLFFAYVLAGLSTIPFLPHRK